jgi:protein NrfD
MKKLFATLWMLAFVIGVFGVAERIMNGLRPTALGSYVVWGVWIAADIYFIGLSAGAFLISSLVYVFQVKAVERIGKLALSTALVTLFMALMCAWSDIGHMGRFYEVFTHPQPRSMLAWVLWLYSAYFILLMIELRLALRPDLLRWSHLSNIRGRIARVLLRGNTDVPPEALEKDRKRLRILASIGVPLAIAFHGGMGALFATLVARPYWYGPLYPIVFLAGALVSGTALLSAVTAFGWKGRPEEGEETVVFLGRILLGLLLFDLLLEWAEFSIPSWYGVGREIDLLKVILFGQYWWVFWGFHILLGTMIPLFLLIRYPRNRRSVGLAGALVALSFMSVRLNIVIPGLITPELNGLERAYLGSRLTYAYLPSAAEWALVLFVVSIGTALLLVGYRFLPLLDEPLADGQEARIQTENAT